MTKAKKSARTRKIKVKIGSLGTVEGVAQWVNPELRINGDFVLDNGNELSYKEVTIVIQTPWEMAPFREALNKIEAHWKKILEVR